MKPEKVSLFIVGIIWLGVSIRLLFTGVNGLLTLDFGPKMIIFAVIAVCLGIFKGKVVLQKVAKKYCNNAKLISFTKSDFYIGWAKVLGIRGFILLGIMMSIGFLLRSSSIDKAILGVVCLAVSLGLGYASNVFFTSAKAG